MDMLDNKTYENDNYSVAYSSPWESVDPDELSYCQNNYVGCDFVVYDSSMGDPIIAFSQYPLSDYPDAHTFIIDLWQRYQRDNADNITVLSERDVTITGIPAYRYEYTYVNNNGEVLYVVDIYFHTTPNVIGVIAWVEPAERFEREEVS